MSAAKKWATCTPVAFGGGDDFFLRDSGLLCRGFQALGVDCLAVMPGAPQDGDLDDLLRTDYRNLVSAEWWQRREIEGVVLYAWGRPRFLPVAQAIRRAGIFLVLNQDSGGLVSPLAGLREWLREQARLAGAISGVSWRLRYFLRLLRGLTIGLAVTDPLRAAHLRQGNLVACVTPGAATHYRRLCRIYGGAGLESRVVVLPHPVASHFCDDPEGIREPRVICVGRWDDIVQKRPQMMCEALGQALRDVPFMRATLVGEATSDMREWWTGLPVALRERVHLAGRIGHEELAALLKSGRILYCSSAFESFHIASGEALCSGCSVVAARSDSMVSFDWFSSEQSGSLVDDDSASGHATALCDEIRAWEDGRRSAREISEIWTERLHAHQVASRVLEMVAAR